jgi:thioredoxin-like negative regulator of GroEL
LEKALKARPSLVEAKLELGKAYLAEKRGADAAKLLEQVTAAFPDHNTAHYLLSRAYVMNGDSENARKELALHQAAMKKRQLSRKKRPAPDDPAGAAQ